MAISRQTPWAFAGRLTGKTRNSDWTFDRFRRHAALDQTLEELIDQRGALDVLIDGFAQAPDEAELV